jgi:hypothetical protein
MTYFKDLDPIRYHTDCHDADDWRRPLVAIGWIDRPDLLPENSTMLRRTL